MSEVLPAEHAATCPIAHSAAARADGQRICLLGSVGHPVGLASVLGCARESMRSPDIPLGLRAMSRKLETYAAAFAAV